MTLMCSTFYTTFAQCHWTQILIAAEASLAELNKRLAEVSYAKSLVLAMHFKTLSHILLTTDVIFT